MLISLVSYAFEADAEAEQDDGRDSDYLTLDSIAEPRALWVFEGNVSDPDIIRCRNTMERDYRQSTAEDHHDRLRWSVVISSSAPTRTEHEMFDGEDLVGKLIVQRMETGFR